MTSAYESGRVPEIAVRHRLRIAREFAELEQEQLAERIGLSRSTVSNAENGKGAPRRTTINAWALACGVPASWIKTGFYDNSEGPDGGPGLRITSLKDHLRQTEMRRPRAGDRSPRRTA